MSLSRVFAATLLAFSMTALTARAAEEAPAVAAPEPVAAPQAAPDVMPMTMPGMGPGAMMRGMGGPGPMMGGMGGMNKPCANPGPGKMAGGKSPCQGKAGRSNMAGDDRRVEELEKRLDALQMTVEMLVRQQNAGDR